MIGIGKIEHVVLLAEPQFVFGLAAQRRQSDAGIWIGRIQIKRPLKLEGCCVAFTRGTQCSSVSLAEIGALGVKLNSAVECPKRFVGSALPEIDIAQAHPVIGVIGDSLDDREVLFFGTSQISRPRQNSSAPRPDIHVLRSKGDLGIHYVQGGSPIPGLSILPDLRLPLWRLLLLSRRPWGRQEHSHK